MTPGGDGDIGHSRDGGLDEVEANEALETLSNLCAIAEQSRGVDLGLVIEQIDDTGTPEELSYTVAVELADMVRADQAQMGHMVLHTDSCNACAFSFPSPKRILGSVPGPTFGVTLTTSRSSMLELSGSWRTSYSPS